MSKRLLSWPCKHGGHDLKQTTDAGNAGSLSSVVAHTFFTFKATHYEWHSLRGAQRQVMLAKSLFVHPNSQGCSRVRVFARAPS